MTAMKLDLTRYTCWGFGILAIFGLGTWVVETRYVLDGYRDFIESEYRPQLSLVEREMRISHEIDPCASEDRRFAQAEARDRVLSRVRDALSGQEVFDASWSEDGHHAIGVLKLMPTGFSYNRLLKSSSADGSHVLYYGRAQDGTQLLVYQGWINNSPWNRQYEVAFRRSVLDSARKCK